LQFGEEQDSGLVGGDIVDILYMTLGGDKMQGNSEGKKGACIVGIVDWRDN
jgi:hypothetical protein